GPNFGSAEGVAASFSPASKRAGSRQMAAVNRRQQAKRPDAYASILRKIRIRPAARSLTSYVCAPATHSSRRTSAHGRSSYSGSRPTIAFAAAAMSSTRAAGKRRRSTTRTFSRSIIGLAPGSGLLDDQHALHAGDEVPREAADVVVLPRLRRRLERDLHRLAGSGQTGRRQHARLH